MGAGSRGRVGTRPVVSIGEAVGVVLVSIGVVDVFSGTAGSRVSVLVVACDSSCSCDGCAVSGVSVVVPVVSGPASIVVVCVSAG